MYLKDGQNLNFAIPADRIELLRRSRSGWAGAYSLGPAAQPASQSRALPARQPNLPIALGNVRAVMVTPSAAGPVATEGGITAQWITERAGKALRAAGFQVFPSEEAARKAGTYALELTIEIDSMRIEGTGYYPWTLSLELLDTSDFTDGSSGVVAVWQSGEHGFGGSQVVVDQVAREIDKKIDKFAIDALKERSQGTSERPQTERFVDPFAQ